MTKAEREERRKRAEARVEGIYAGIPDPVMREWFARARSHGTLHKSWFEVKFGSAEWKAWLEYFDFEVGWRPVTFGRQEPCDYRNGKWVLRYKSWTAPCRWPAELGF